jgi:hypothetical protein
MVWLGWLGKSHSAHRAYVARLPLSVRIIPSIFGWVAAVGFEERCLDGDGECSPCVRW